MKMVGILCLCIFASAAARAQTKTIVFVCEHGSAKSVIAATYFNKLAKAKNIPWQAVARGTNPDATLSPKTKTLLAADNLLDSTFVPSKLSQQDVDAAQHVILFYSFPPTLHGDGKTLSWQHVRAANDDFQILRDNILLKLTPLLDSLSKH
ncbi:hypothetical protein [Chryseolinea lacunae]|uniref:Protein-tyrosine-phosphatase n=1 Tax=Chryseolinea lacunae TaxID=2801331 RepID=A0ABS1KLP7_9BACT|nr:hypothetical protein [Chryseolinea lacunae]MBL0739612.1 hypothetical protein [Chryseolinea lacunae]